MTGEVELTGKITKLLLKFQINERQTSCGQQVYVPLARFRRYKKKYNKLIDNNFKSLMIRLY